jgi:predicted transcriptional regulator
MGRLSAASSIAARFTDILMERAVAPIDWIRLDSSSNKTEAANLCEDIQCTN